MTEREYKYSVTEEGGAKYVDVEMAGRVEVSRGENAEDKAKALIVSTQQVPEESVKLCKVDDLNEGVITSDETPNK